MRRPKPVVVDVSVSSRRYSKVRQVPINQMRVPPAGVSQRRFSKAQGDEYAARLDLDKLGIPIMNLRDGIYWILDGQHRIYALKQNGFSDDVLDCEVYENLTDAEMADIFLGRDDRRAINPFEKFLVACTAERMRECDIRRTIESNGLRIGRGAEAIGCVSALGHVYDRSGPTILGQVARTLRDAFGVDGFDGALVEGTGLVFSRFNGHTNEKEIARRLGLVKGGASGLLKLTQLKRETTGAQKVQCVAAVIVEVNNKNGRSDKLPSWWRSRPEDIDEARHAVTAAGNVNAGAAKK